MGCKKSKIKKASLDSDTKKKVKCTFKPSPEENEETLCRDAERYKMLFAKNLQKYELKTLIGKGKFGIVFRAENKFTKRPCAIKFPKNKEELGCCNSVSNESHHLASLRHENIVQLIEVILCKGNNPCVLLVMDLAVGGTLLEKLKINKHGLNSESEVSGIVTMLLRAVHYLHVECCITHRNIKPANILFYYTGVDSKILLTGFQYAYSRKDGNDEYMDDVVGTADYRAPEMLQGNPYNCLVDLWSVGIVAYMSLTGVHPFHTREKSDRISLIIQGQYNRLNSKWKSVSPAGREFVGKLLTARPENRCTAAKALNHEWIGSSTVVSDSLDSSDCESLSTPSPPTSSQLYRIKLRRPKVL